MTISLNKYPLYAIVVFIAVFFMSSFVLPIFQALLSGALAMSVYLISVVNGMESDITFLEDELTDNLMINDEDFVHLELETVEGTKVSQLIAVSDYNKTIEAIEGTKAKVKDYKVLKELELRPEAMVTLKQQTQDALDKEV